MKKRNKKRTVLSIVAVMVCLIMLVGTAYAAWEYKVTNYGNKITIGGIAAELLKYDETSSQYQDISNGTAGIFDDVTMQAGNTEIVYLQVKNTGTLSLYYDLVLNVSVKNGDVEVTGEDAEGLKSVLQYAVAEGKRAPVETALIWDDFAYPVGMTNGKHMPIVGNALDVDESEYFALAVNLENAQNYIGYTIEIDAEVVAKDVSSDLLNGDGDFEGEVTYVKDTKGGTWVAFKDTYKDANVSIVGGTEEAPAPSGTRYLKQLADGTTSTMAYICNSQGIPVTPGKTYRIEYKIKRDNTTSGKNGEHALSLGVYAYDANDTQKGYLITSTSYAESNGKWINKTDTFTMPDDSSYVKIIFSGNAAIKFSIDDIKFYEVTETTATE